MQSATAEAYGDIDTEYSSERRHTKRTSAVYTGFCRGAGRSTQPKNRPLAENQRDQEKFIGDVKRRKLWGTCLTPAKTHVQIEVHTVKLK